jgi:hypothetical protein
MNKNEYVTGNTVEAFVAWMSARLDDASFAHGYTLRRGNIPWSCASLFDAYDRYQWGHVELPEFGLPAGSSFASNLRVLETLQTELRAGLAAADNARVLAAAIAVMKWGGVTRGNVPWLEAWRDDLCRIIGATGEAINAGDTCHPLFAQSELRFTSGMSKVYALVCDDFAIYDSRVAAALCRAVVLFCRETGLDRMPEDLAFPWAAAKSSPNAPNPPLRNAAQDGYMFPRLMRGRAYVVWNMKASWLLSAIASHRSTRDSAFARLDSKAQRLRALEAALFMFGYDLVDGGRGGQERDGATPITPVIADSPRPDADAASEDGWVHCKTRARRVGFEYRLALAADGIHTRNLNGDKPVRFSDAEINSTLQELLEFPDHLFPLANSVTGVPAGTVPKGLGTAFWRRTNRSPGHTSRLAAVLESIGVFRTCDNPASAGKHWSLDIETLNVDEASGKVDIRPYLDAIIQGD